MSYSLVFKHKGQDNQHLNYLNKKDAIRAADMILLSVTGFSLLEELNKMQLYSSSGGDIPEAFKNKSNIPDYFINLILSKYNMELISK